MLFLDGLPKRASKIQRTAAWSSPHAVRSRGRRLSERGRGGGVVDPQLARRVRSLSCA
jgi:hypothetical protein